MSLVLDSSATIAFILPDECTSDLLALFQKIAISTAWAPELWKLEVANALSVGVRRKRLLQEEQDASIHRLQRLPIQFDTETGVRAWGPILELADRHGLTPYDAVYLELALRRSLPLATLDSDLSRAAEAEDIPLIHL